MGTVADNFDEALTQARAGEESGFLYIWQGLQPRLLRYLRVIGCDDIDDVASETWLQVVRDLRRFKGGEDDFRRWLFTIGRHRAVDAARAMGRLRQRQFAVDEIVLPAVAGNPVEDEVLDGLSTRQAIAMVAALSRDQAEVVALRIIAGLDTTAVAAILGKSSGAVRIALHRGLRSLAANPSTLGLEAVE